MLAKDSWSFKETLINSRWYDSGLYCLIGTAHYVWPCDRIRQPAGIAWLLRGMCVTLGLTLHSERSVEPNTAWSCYLNSHVMAGKAGTWVRSGHRILCGLPLCAESVFGCRRGDRHDIEECRWCHQNIRQGEGNALCSLQVENHSIRSQRFVSDLFSRDTLTI